MNQVKALICLLAIFLAGTAIAQTPAISFDIDNAQGVNYYFFSFYGNQTLGSVYEVTGDSELTVTHLGVFDMNPDNEPYWDVDNPAQAEHGLQMHHAVAVFDYPSMHLRGEVLIPAGTGAPIQDEGYRYLPLDEPVVLQPGAQFVLAAWWGTMDIENPGSDTFYLMGDSPDTIFSTVTFHEDLAMLEGCFNPSAGDGTTVDPPFIFSMFWGLYAGGANLIIDEPVAVESKTLSDVKSLFR